LPHPANLPGQPSNSATEAPQSPKICRQFTPARRSFRRTRRHFNPSRRNLKQYLKAQREARIPRFPAGTNEFLAGTRERLEIRATCMESITSHFPRWDKIACSQNALLWCIQYLKYHFNILIFEVPRGSLFQPRHLACAQNFFLYRAGAAAIPRDLAKGAVSSLPPKSFSAPRHLSRRAIIPANSSPVPALRCALVCLRLRGCVSPCETGRHRAAAGVPGRC